MAEHDSMESFTSEAGLFTYAQILHLLKIEFSRARRYDYPLTCSLFQIDRIDHLKDLYGFRVRDQIEERVVSLVHQMSRASDFLGKVGERMILILPHTGSEGVRILMQRVSDALNDMSFEIDGRNVSITLSAGVATYENKNALFFDSVMKNAEVALREVLARGGNGISVYSPKRDAPASGPPRV